MSGARRSPPVGGAQLGSGYGSRRPWSSGRYGARLLVHHTDRRSKRLSKIVNNIHDRERFGGEVARTLAKLYINISTDERNGQDDVNREIQDEITDEPGRSTEEPSFPPSIERHRRPFPDHQKRSPSRFERGNDQSERRQQVVKEKTEG